MCLTLIFTGEVQVDIRLLIPLKSKERFKRDIKTVLDQLFAAVRTDLIRHITSCLTGICLNLG